MSPPNKMWLHVDAAWAGAAGVCPEHRDMLRGVERADSFSFNPHKWLLTNFDCAALWTSDRQSLINALTINPTYLQNQQSEAGRVIDYRDWQIPLGRRFRALKLWFVLRHYGVDGLRAHIRRHVAWAAEFAAWVGSDARFEVVSHSLALVGFRLRAGDDATDALLERLNQSGTIYLTATAVSLPGSSGRPRRVIRFAIGAVQTERRHVEAAWRQIQAEADRLPA